MSESASLPFVFGGLEPERCAFSAASVLIWPVPFEKTVTYGRGTREGPAAIVEASRNMELYDDEVGGEPADIGIHTLPAMDADHEPHEMMPRLQQETARLLDTGKFLCTLGGEHSITPPLVRAFKEKYPDLSVLQVDAHADLRDRYDGTVYSHASAMRRVLETCPAVQVGIRSLSSEEARIAPTLPTRIFYAKDIIHDDDWAGRAVDSLTPNVYLTLDVDGLDPSLLPNTGTPEPGGLMWYDVLHLLRTLAARRRVVGMDVVELCGPTNSVSSFVTAKLIYKALAYIFQQQIPKAT